MKKIVFAALAIGAALALSGCGSIFSPSASLADNPSAIAATPIGSAATDSGAQAVPAATTALNQAQVIVFKARAAYDAAFLVPASNYAKLPRCAAGETISLTTLCSDSRVIAQLRKADASAKTAFDAAETIAAKAPNTDALTLLKDVEVAVGAAEQIVTNYNIQ